MECLRFIKPNKIYEFNPRGFLKIWISYYQKLYGKYALGKERNRSCLHLHKRMFYSRSNHSMEYQWRRETLLNVKRALSKTRKGKVKVCFPFAPNDNMQYALRFISFSTYYSNKTIETQIVWSQLCFHHMITLLSDSLTLCMMNGVMMCYCVSCDCTNELDINS